MDTPSGADNGAVFALLQEGKPLVDHLQELLYLRKWKEEQILAQEEERRRHERMLTRLCVRLVAPGNVPKMTDPLT